MRGHGEVLDVVDAELPAPPGIEDGRADPAQSEELAHVGDRLAEPRRDVLLHQSGFTELGKGDHLVGLMHRGLVDVRGEAGLPGGPDVVLDHGDMRLARDPACRGQGFESGQAAVTVDDEEDPAGLNDNEGLQDAERIDACGERIETGVAAGAPDVDDAGRRVGVVASAEVIEGDVLHDAPVI